MSLLLDAFWRAVAYCLHPRVMILSLLPLVGIAALAFVRAEAKIPARTLAAGIPAKVLRELSADEIQWKRDNAALYQLS